MIGFNNCSYVYEGDLEERRILSGATLTFNINDRICILAHSGSGKTTILSLLRGKLKPTDGMVVCHQKLSWPLGAAGALNPAMTGEENILTLAALCRVNPNKTSAYAYKFSELGDSYFHPVNSYSASERARLAYAFSYAKPAYMYLAEDGIGTGETEFVAKCKAALMQRLQHAGLFLITRNPRVGKDVADQFIVLEDGKFIQCDSYDEAVQLFERVKSQAADIFDLVEGFNTVD